MFWAKFLLSDVLDHKFDVDFFVSSATRRESETELGTSENLFFFLGLHLTSGSKSLCVGVM